MSYGDDFATVDPAGAPLDPVIMVGADPLFWGAVLLALLVAALIGWLTGAGSRANRPDAARAIWAAVDDAAKAAMKADTDALPAHASHLHRVLRDRLGKTLAFGGELDRCVGALDTALKGEVDRPGRHVSAADDDETGEPGPDGHGPGGAPANVTIVSIHPPSAPAQPHPPGHGKRPMTTKQRNHALRLAVADFNDYWRHRSAREDEMRGVVAELCDPGPRLSHGGDRH